MTITICPDCNSPNDRCECDFAGVRVQRKIDALVAERDQLQGLVAAVKKLAVPYQLTSDTPTSRALQAAGIQALTQGAALSPEIVSQHDAGTWNAAIDAALKAVGDERLVDPDGSEDAAYERALDDAEIAIEALRRPAKAEGASRG